MTVMRKNAVFIISLLGLALPSCANPIYRDYVYSPLNSDPFVEIQKDGFYRIGDYDSYESNGHKINMDFSSIYQLGNVRFNMPTVGEVPLLVIPIDFEDSVGNISSIKNIESAFKGDNGTNQYVSVAEYYDRCSMGRLHLLPHVTDRFFRSSTYPKKSDLASLTGSGAVSTLTRLYNEALAWFGETYPSIPLDDYSFLAKNGSKKIPLYFIYNAPYSGEADGSSNRDSMFWAFTINSPAPISWSSIDMMHLSSNKVDAHTYIHETGHLLGLEDYYDTFSTSILSKVSPLGRMDMMDCSLGDQNAFSKMLLGWERPFVPTSDCDITIHQSSLNNECILLSPSWNKTLFDQYVLLEFYTPTGLNKVDALYRNDPSMRLMRRTGVKAYLIRGNLKLYNGNVQTGEYLTPNNYNGGRLYFGRNNNSKDNPLIQTLNKYGNKVTLPDYFVASDHEEDVSFIQNGEVVSIHLSESLFFQNEGIDNEHFSDLRINGNKLGCSFKVSELTSSYAKIKITFDK